MRVVLVVGAILAVGLLIGWGLGGGLRTLADLRIRAWWLAPLALALQWAPVPEVGENLGRFLPAAALGLSYILLMAVAAVNLRTRGFGLILLGLTLNLTVILVNQGMPVSAHALQQMGRPEAIQELRERERGARHRLATQDDLLGFLGDVIPLRSPFNAVVSPGDLFAYAGGAALLANAMLGRSSRDEEPEYPPEPTATPS